MSEVIALWDSTHAFFGVDRSPQPELKTADIEEAIRRGAEAIREANLKPELPIFVSPSQMKELRKLATVGIGQPSSSSGFPVSTLHGVQVVEAPELERPNVRERFLKAQRGMREAERESLDWWRARRQRSYWRSQL